MEPNLDTSRLTRTLIDLTRLFDYSALLSIALMAATIPTYAISVSFLGRESKRTKQETQRRRDELSKRIGELSNRRGSPLETAVQSELKATTTEMEKLKAPVYRLSVFGAVIIPVTLFAGGLTFAGLGLWYSAEVASTYGGLLSGVASAAFNGVGLFQLFRTLLTVNKVALLPQTLADFEVTFTSGKKHQRLKASAPTTLAFEIHNFGSEYAEEVEAVLWMPHEFKVLPSEAYGVAQPSTRPDLTTVNVDIGKIKPEAWRYLTVPVESPSERGDYEIQCSLYEKKLGKTRHFLTVSVV